MKPQYTPASAQRQRFEAAASCVHVLQGEEYCVSILFISSYISTSRGTGHRVKSKGHQGKIRCKSLVVVNVRRTTVMFKFTFSGTKSSEFY